MTHRHTDHYLGVGSAGFGHSCDKRGISLGRLFGFGGGGKFNLVVSRRLRLSSEGFWLSEGRPMGLNYYCIYIGGVVFVVVS